MLEQTFFRRAVLAAAVALSFAAVDAAAGAAGAMPVAAAPAASGLTTVQYYGYRHRYRRYGRRHAGVYNCGRGALHTHLERKACGFAPRGHNGLYRYR